MSATMTWSIDWMECKPREGDLVEVVVNAGWRCTGVQDDVSLAIYGSCVLPGPGNPFTPYPDLTQEQVLSWCFANGVDQTEVETNLQRQINEALNPPVVQPPLPWKQPEGEKRG